MMGARRAFRLNRSDRDESLFDGSESVRRMSLPTEWRCDSRRGGVPIPPAAARSMALPTLLPRLDKLEARLDDVDVLAPFLEPVTTGPQGFLGWLDRTLEKL